jgi:hypothetical protein
MSGRRIELSATQVIASLLAAVTGAVAASYAGVAGTVIGVAVMSLASTAGAAVYKHYLARSKERLRSAAEVIAPLAAFNGVPGHRARRAASGVAKLPDSPARPAGERAPGPQAGVAGASAGVAGQAADAGTAANGTGAGTAANGTGAAARRVLAAGQLSGWPWSPDSPVTEEFPAVGSGVTAGWSTWPAESAARPGSGDADPAEIPREMGNSPGARAGHGGLSTGADREAAERADPGPAPDGPGGEQARPAGLRSSGRRWPAMAGAAIGVFVLTLGGITAFEVAAGKPLDALIWGRDTEGTTIGSVTGAQHASRAQPRRAAPTPSHRPAAKPTPAPSPPASSPTPTPTPTPTATRSASPSPSPTGSSTAAASPSGSRRGGTAAHGP